MTKRKIPLRRIDRTETAQRMEHITARVPRSDLLNLRRMVPTHWTLGRTIREAIRAFLRPPYTSPQNSSTSSSENSVPASEISSSSPEP